MSEIDLSSETKGLEEVKGPKRKPLNFILAVFLMLILILMIIPDYSVRTNPEPKNIPKLSDVLPPNISASNYTLIINQKQDFLLLIELDPVVKQVADKIAAVSCESDVVCQAKALFYFVRDNFDYVSDPTNSEYVKTARESLISQGGDCDDGAVLLANLMQAIGIQTRFVFIPGHVYVQARIEEAPKKYKQDGWINLDVTCNSCGFGEIPYTSLNEEKEFVG